MSMYSSNRKACHTTARFARGEYRNDAETHG
jgi:hypothetical protein